MNSFETKDYLRSDGKDNDPYIHDSFWSDDPTVLYKTDRLLEFFPSKQYSLAENLNALTRFSVYCSVLLYLFRPSYTIFYLPLFFFVMTYLIWTYREFTEKFGFTKELQVDKDTNEDTTKPTLSNPFMNVLLTDYVDNPQRGEAASRENVQEDVETKFDFNLYREIDDVYRRNHSERQFFTMPYTTIPNDQGGFASWLYKTGKTEKEKTLDTSLNLSP